MSKLKAAREATKANVITLPNSEVTIDCYPLGRGSIDGLIDLVTLDAAAAALETGSVAGIWKFGNGFLAAYIVAGLREDTDETLEDFDALAAEDQRAIIVGIYEATFPKGIADFFGGSARLEGLIGSLTEQAKGLISSYIQQTAKTTEQEDSSISEVQTSKTSSTQPNENDSPESPTPSKPAEEAELTPKRAEDWATSSG